MGRYIGRRALWAVVVLVIMISITFVIYFVMPPNTSVYEQFTHGAETTRASELTKSALGLDRPLYVQYGLFMKHLFLGDQYGWPGMWMSFQTRSALKPIIASRAIVTFQLALGAAVVWLMIGIPLGIISALKPRSKVDRFSMGFALFAASTPVFFLGMLVLYVFWFKLGIIPGAGYRPLTDGFVPWFSHMIVPWIVLALLFAAYYARMSRASMIEALDEDYVQTARGKGLSERRVIFRHAFRSAMLPLVTMFGMDLGALFGGAVITETVFNLPGLGAYAVQAVHHADLYAILDITVVVAIAITTMNLFVDIAYAWLDPRIRYA
jgi:peptide/nickel transport system permease protein